MLVFVENLIELRKDRSVDVILIFYWYSVQHKERIQQSSDGTRK